MGGCWENEISLVITTDNLQNDGDNKFYRKWNTDRKIRRTGMLPNFDRWIPTVLNFSLGSQHFPLLHFISWQCSYSCCPSQGIFPSSASKLLYRCLTTTDLFVGLFTHPLFATYWMSLVHEDWSFCRYTFHASFITSYVLCLVSLLTSTVISVDRLLALLLGLRYRQVVTLKRTYMIVATFWVVSGVATLCYILDPRITDWYGYMIIPSCLVFSVASYTKIFHALSHHQTQVQGHVEQQPSQSNALNLARYRKAVYSALWVQIALVVCYCPYLIVVFFLTTSRQCSTLSFAFGISTVLVSFNSTLNPFLYCWKISEVRQAVKQTIREVLCCPWS